MTRTMRAVGLAVLMVVSVAAPAMGATASVEQLSVDVAQDDGVTVTVTNGTANGTVANASVNVTTVADNATYDGAGEYTTGSNGTVGLPTPNETVDVTITATKDGVSTTETATLTADGNESTPFGLQVVGFISRLNETEGPRGLAIAEWVTANNPGNGSGPPEHAGPGNETRGPPDHAGNGSENGTQGPPDHAGNDDENGTQGPPDHAGNGPDDDGNGTGDGNETDHAGDETDDDGRDDGNGNGDSGNGNGNGGNGGGNGNGAGKAKDR